MTTPSENNEKLNKIIPVFISSSDSTIRATEDLGLIVLSRLNKNTDSESILKRIVLVESVLFELKNRYEDLKTFEAYDGDDLVYENKSVKSTSGSLYVNISTP